MIKIKKTLRIIDRYVFKNQASRWYNKIFQISFKVRQVKLFRLFSSNFDYKITIYYQKDMNSELSRLCDLYGSDKGEIESHGHPYPWKSHTYADYYSNLFLNCRDQIRKVFECGIGTNNPNLSSSMGINGKPGASLRVWKDFFPNATIYGADIDKEILFGEDRIVTGFLDQLDDLTIRTYWNDLGVSNFDLMIDDGLHTFEAGSILFLNSIDRLATNGIYIIEDVNLSDMKRFKSFFLGKTFQVDYIFLVGPNSNSDNNLILIRK